MSKVETLTVERKIASMQPIEPESSVKVFISYTHADREWRKKLEDHLSPLKYSGKITIWQDQEIPAGANWEDQINTHLNEADLILLLVSASFIASKYCWNKEVQLALQRHKAGMTKVIPIILKPALWQETPLGQLQALPTGAKPVTHWNDRDAALENVAKGIGGVVTSSLTTLRDSMLASTSPVPSTKPSTPVSPARTKEQWLKEGSVLGNLERHEEALNVYEQAIRLDPNDAHAYYGKGNAFYRLTRYEEALSAFEQAIRLDPDYASAYYGKGSALGNLKRYKEALRAFEQAIRLDPDYTDAYYNKGIALNDLKRYEEALRAFEQAIRLDPDYTDAYQGKGFALGQLGRHEKAQRAYKKALQLGYDN